MLVLALVGLPLVVNLLVLLVLMTTVLEWVRLVLLRAVLFCITLAQAVAVAEPQWRCHSPLLGSVVKTCNQHRAVKC